MLICPYFKDSAVSDFLLFAFAMLIIAGLSACHDDKPLNQNQIDELLPFNLKKPALELKLSSELKEISGLTYWKEDQLAGVQDEKGFVFIIDALTGDIIEKRKFAKKGDYEGIAKAKRTLFIVRNDGDLHEVIPITSRKKARLIETKLGAKNDVEGLCYHEEENALLLACKEKSGIDEHDAGRRAIFKFSLEDNALDSIPFLLIEENEIARRLKKKKIKFKPSGLAIDPVSDHLFVLSATNHLLVVLNLKGEILRVEELEKKDLKQAEGIAFSNGGDLFISTEGKKGKARILKYKRQLN